MSISPKRRRAIIAAHGGVCHYCGSANATHVDHIVPKADGGTDDLGNLIPACLPCNLYKCRSRLPPDAEQKALHAAEAARQTVLLLLAPPERQGGDSLLDQRVPISMTASMVAGIDAWRRKRGIDSRSEAVRQMIEDILGP